MKYIVVLLTLFIVSTSIASDHIDGPITTEHGQSDITDLYAFPTPEKSNSLTLIMNSYPMMPHRGHFEERLRYIFRIRQSEIKNKKVKTLSEVKIVCRFVDPHRRRNKAQCQSDIGGLEVYGKIDVINKGTGLKLWAGRRSDPFFFNAKWAGAATKGILLPLTDENTMDKMNVLSIVIEVDTKKLFPDKPENSLYAVVGEIDVKNSNSEPAKLLDRVGRPEITNVTMVGNKDGDQELRDMYNVEETFYVNPENKKMYFGRIMRNISFFDGLDDNAQDWKPVTRKELTSLLIDDFLLVDVDKTCSEKSFLSIEKSILAGKVHSRCGGRFVNEDIMDELFSYYINGSKQVIKDGVDKPYRAISQQFPYLAKPDNSLAAAIKAAAARKKLK